MLAAAQQSGDLIHLCSPAIADEWAAYLSCSHTLFSAKSSRKRTEAACSRSSSSCGDFPQYKTLWLLSWLLSTLSLSCCVFEILLVVLRKTTRIFSRGIKEVTVKYPLSPASNVLCLWVAGRGFYLHKLWWEADKQSIYRVSGVIHDARGLFPASGGLLLCRRATRWCRRTGCPPPHICRTKLGLSSPVQCVSVS